MKRFSAPPTVYADPTRPPDDDDSDASSLSDGSKKVKTAQSFESLFNSESLSDIVLDINGGEYVFHAHKMIVGLKSERLAALITKAITSAPTDDNIGEGKPILYLREPDECSAVFSRFLYFIYSGAVWLHRDYVVPLFQLSVKYGVAALAAHCENYIVQILTKMLHIDPALPLTQSLQIASVSDLFEEPCYRDDTKKAAFKVLCKRFGDFVRTEKWITASWTTVRDLLHSDDCWSEENLILVSATDWMKRNKLQDKARIQEILSAIRYPRLPRRVLYHLHATSSFKKFPPVQDLIDAAIRYHCFKDVPEAQAEFTGLQYRTRGCGSGSLNNNNNNEHFCGSISNNSNNNNNNDENSNNRNIRHTSMCGVENGGENEISPSADAADIEFEQTSNDNNHNNNNNTLFQPPLTSSSSSSATSSATTSPEENNAISFPGEFHNSGNHSNDISSSSTLPSASSSSSRNGIGARGGELPHCHHRYNHHYNHHHPHHTNHRNHHSRLRQNHGSSLNINDNNRNNEDDDIDDSYNVDYDPPSLSSTTNLTSPPKSLTTSTNLLHTFASSTAPTLPLRQHRSRSEDRHQSPAREQQHRVKSGSRQHNNHHHNHHQHHRPHHNHSNNTIPSTLSVIATAMTSSSTATNSLNRQHIGVGSNLDPPAISSFHSPCSPVATIQPLVVHGSRRTTSDNSGQELIEDDEISDRSEMGRGVGGEVNIAMVPPTSLGGNVIMNNSVNANNTSTSTANNDFDNNNVICHSHIRRL